MNGNAQKVAVIAGASQGIGAALVSGYRKLGYAVAATSRSIRPSDDPGVLTVAGDIGDPAAAERVVAEAVRAYGRIDTLVDNAGIFEYAARGIRANAVSPGIIKTPMHPAETHAVLGSMHPVGRMGEIDDIVSAVLYMETAPFVTGETLHVDGGQSAGR